MARPGLHYGVPECPGCHLGVAAGLELEATGQVKLDKEPYLKGRKIIKRTGEDRGPRFGPEHEREYAEVRHAACGHVWWTSAPQAIEDAKAARDGKALRMLEPVRIPESLGGPPAEPEPPAKPKKRRG